MGTPIPKPFEPPPVSAGNLCTQCWGAGKAFGDIATPLSVWLILSGIQKGPNWSAGDGEPIEGRFEIPQLSAQPCVYGATLDGDFFTVNFSTTISRTRVIAAGNKEQFNDSTGRDCGLLYYNQSNDLFTGGTIKIAFGEIS